MQLCCLRLFFLILLLAFDGSAQKNVRPGGGGARGVPKSAEKRIEKLGRMSPQQRQKALEGLPPKRQQEIEKRLNDYQRLSPEQRSKLWERKKRFDELPPEKQKQVRRMAQQVGALPDDRRKQVIGELDALRDLPEGDRRARMNTEEFRSKFTAGEQRMLRDASSILPE